MQNLTNFFLTLVAFLSVLTCAGSKVGEDNIHKTKVSILGDKWYFNDQILNPGSPAEGLLMNVRMVNSVFEDISPTATKLDAGFDPMTNTDSFISKIPEYVANGVNAFTISLQGGAPGYEGAVNTAFDANGSLREAYLQRVEKVVRACDKNHAAVILSCFYQRQHSHGSALNGKASIIRALENSVQWITQKKFTNVILEVSNEYRHGGYLKWPDGDWLITDAAQIELIDRAKSLNTALLVSTSGMGNGEVNEQLAQKVDYLVIHLNNTALEQFAEKIGQLKRYGKPILCNEDDKLDKEGESALMLSVSNGAGWGFMHSKKNQTLPFSYDGFRDDTLVYRGMKNVTTKDFRIDTTLVYQNSITITHPKDGDIFQLGQRISIQYTHAKQTNGQSNSVEILVNGNPLERLVDGSDRLGWEPKNAGVFIVEALVKSPAGEILYRSPKVDFIVKGIQSARSQSWNYVVEAESYSSLKGSGWMLKDSIANHKGFGYMEVAGQGTLNYTVNFPKAGTYFLYLRTWANSATSNGVNLKIDEQSLTDNGIHKAVYVVKKSAWNYSSQWQSYTEGKHYGPLELHIKTAGNHTITLMSREIGFRIDKLVLVSEKVTPPGDYNSTFVEEGLQKLDELPDNH